ncbi:amidase [Tenggerimyces flavus]|uniref:Amidase n=1 Tax=Tenggerimyces flavus TaxID=1708749 RepID=A0ABV7YAK5_9ACTN|nr:amidase [Tenggerimyces flavus]MBM7785133.1 aspartyl-tRNA(Asn)/glutamyl-tRNA(Gln) amidotransferase subunit A [Tenggerimyces flavus]
MADAADLSASELLAAYAAKQLSPVEATRAALARIEARDQELNAFCLLDEEGALEAARESERRWQQGEPDGLLDGVPTAIKDIVLTRDWPTLRGSRTIDPQGPWEEDAPTVARLREHRAIFVGKTTTPELGWKGVTDSPLTGITRNPHDPTRTPGGSSGGSAVAVQTGMAALAIGTDGGGSIRIPAGFTGVVGFKPTFGRVPIYPPSAFGTLSHAGPIARTVEDAARMLDVLSRPDPRDWSGLPPTQGSYLDALTEGVEGMRIAFSPTLGYVHNDPQVEAHVRKAAHVFAERGADVDETDPGFHDPIRAFEVLWYAGAAASVATMTDEQRELIDEGLAEIAHQGSALTALDYLAATKERTDLGERMGRFHQTHDLLLTPTLPITAFEAGRESPDGERWMTWTPFTYPFNLTQQPAISVPCGQDANGLPVGLQIVGARHAERQVLAAAAVFREDAEASTVRTAASP